MRDFLKEKSVYISFLTIMTFFINQDFSLDFKPALVITEKENQIVTEKSYIGYMNECDNTSEAAAKLESRVEFLEYKVLNLTKLMENNSKQKDETNMMDIGLLKTVLSGIKF